MDKKSKYSSLSDWRKAEPKAYAGAKRKGLIDEICKTFGWEQKKLVRYDENQIITLALRCKTFDGFIAKHKKAYECACELKIEDKVKKAIEDKLKKQKGLYTKEYVLELANKSSSYFSFCENYKSASKAAIKNNWDEEIFELIDKKKWEDMRDVRAFCAYTQSKEFLELFDKFKKTFVDIPYIKPYRY